MTNRFKTALALQDAVNLRAIARELVTIADQAAVDDSSTMAVRRDPAVVMTVLKLAEMCGLVVIAGTLPGDWARRKV